MTALGLTTRRGTPRKRRAPGTAPHGSRTRYKHGCRCEACTLANREFQRRDRDRREAQGLTRGYPRTGPRPRRQSAEQTERALARLDAIPVGDPGLRCPTCRQRLDFTTNGHGLAIATCRWGHYTAPAHRRAS